MWANELGPYGTLVVIEHEPDLHTAYGHLNFAPPVSIGQRVRAGQRIGAVGSTGLATGPHLHFEVRNNGTPVDPKPWIERQPAYLSALLDAIAAKTLRNTQSSADDSGKHAPRSLQPTGPTCEDGTKRDYRAVRDRPADSDVISGSVVCSRVTSGSPSPEGSHDVTSLYGE